jgi:hypothetical protein
MSPGREPEPNADERGRVEPPVEKLLHLAGPDSLLRSAGPDDEPAGAFVSLNVGGVVPVVRIPDDAAEMPDDG